MVNGLKPYPAYRDSGLSWLGRVPEHWPLFRFKSHVSNVIEQKKDNSNNNLYIELEDVESWTGKIHLCDKELTIDNQVKHFRSGDVLFGKLRPYLAKVARPCQDGVCVGEFLVLRSSDEAVSNEYLEKVLRSSPVIDVINSSTFGAKMPRADWQFIGNLRLPSPSSPEQAAIVRFLDYADRRIRRYIWAKQKLITLLNEQKQAIINRAVTRGLDPNVRLRPSGVERLGLIPEHWEIVPLGMLLAERKEKNNPIKTDNILSLTMDAGVIPYSEKKPGGNKAKDDLSAYMLAYPGDIVVNSMNVVVGSVGLCRYFGAVSPVYYVLYPRNANDLVTYYNAIFQDTVFQRSLFGLGNGIMFIRSKSSGKLNTIRLRIPIGKLESIPITRIGPKEQAAIVEYITQEKNRLDKAIAIAQREINLLLEYRKSLIAEVVTGKLDVCEVATRLPDESDDNSVYGILESDDIGKEGEEGDQDAE